MMRKSMSRFGLIALSIMVLAGCVAAPKYRPELPEELVGDSGLVVGQVVGIDRLSSWSRSGEVMINNKKRGSIVNGFIAIPLSPGEYTLTGLYSQSVTVSGTMTYTHTTTLPLKRAFAVRPRSVTNLGLIVLYPDAADKENKKFLRLFVDNTSDMKHFVKTSYPVLAAALRSDTMTLAPGDLLTANLLELLRKDLAAREASIVGAYSTYVASDVGTLAEVQKSKEGKITGVKLIEAGTVSNLQSRSPNYVQDRFAFLTTNNRLFFIQDGKAAEKRPPAGLRAGKVYVFGSGEMVLVDDKFEIYTSYNNGDRWQPYLGFLSEKNVDVDVSPGAKGYYAYAKIPPQAFFAAYGRQEFRPIELPLDMKNLALLRERSVGLFAERESSVWKEKEQRPFYFRAAGKTAWEQRSMPGINCDYISFLDVEGNSLSTTCGERSLDIGKNGKWTTGSGNRAQFVSKDSGKTWQKK